MPTDNLLFNTFMSLIDSFNMKLRNDIFVASYGPAELRFFTEAVTEEEQELDGVFTLDTTNEQDQALFREVTESI